MPGATRPGVWGTLRQWPTFESWLGALCVLAVAHQVLADGRLPPSLLPEWCWAPWGQTTEAQAGSSPGFRKWVKDFQQQPWATAQPRPLCSPPSPGFQPCPYHPKAAPTTDHT